MNTKNFSIHNVIFIIYMGAYLFTFTLFCIYPLYNLSLYKLHFATRTIKDGCYAAFILAFFLFFVVKFFCALCFFIAFHLKLANAYTVIYYITPCNGMLAVLVFYFVKRFF